MQTTIVPPEQRLEDAPLVLTIGHSTRTFEQFLHLLRVGGAEHLIDVRRFPGSRRHPQFGPESLPVRLREEGIGYAHLPELGGRRRPRPDSPNAGWHNPSFRGYADHMETPEFQENLVRLIEHCERKRACLMCSEAVWWRCHRRMIADALVVRGVPVEHVLGESNRQSSTGSRPGPRSSWKKAKVNGLSIRRTGPLAKPPGAYLIAEEQKQTLWKAAFGYTGLGRTSPDLPQPSIFPQRLERAPRRL